MPRANVALPYGFTRSRSDRLAGTRIAPGQVPLPYQESYYWPDEGTARARRLITRRPQFAIRARHLAAEWLRANDPLAPRFAVMANFCAALNAEIELHGETAWFLRYNH